MTIGHDIGVFRLGVDGRIASAADDLLLILIEERFLFQLTQMIAYRRLGQCEHIGGFGVRSFFYNA